MIHPSDAVPLPATAIPLTLIQREYLDDLKCRVSPSHFKNVKSSLDRTVAALQLGNLHELQPVQVIRYRNQQRESGAANRTANLIVDNLGAMFAWALGCGLITTNPLRNIRRLPDGAGNQRYRRRALSDDEIERFLAAAAADNQQTAGTWWVNGGGEADHRRCGHRVPKAALVCVPGDGGAVERARLARNGVGLVQVQRLMGHSDPKLAAQVYTHLDVEDLRQAVETV